MKDLVILLKGWMIGMLTSAPVGPVAMMCIHRTLRENRRHGFVTGAGAAISDSMYATIAALGLTVVSNFLIEREKFFRVSGGVLLLIFGLCFIFFKASADEKEEAFNQFTSFGKAFLITICNPVTFFAFAALFAAFGFTQVGTRGMRDVYLIGGVLLGSLTWWFGLCTISSIFRERFAHPDFTLLRRIEGIILTTFGAVVLLSLL
ncbi:MAG: LysE family translocator [Spartobacteria bacterium]|nr:LysE family translocator [Spartobacteria bacterium]